VSELRDKLERLKAQQVGEDATPDTTLHGTPPGPLQIGGALGAVGAAGYGAYKASGPIVRGVKNVGANTIGKFILRRAADAVHPGVGTAMDVAEAVQNARAQRTQPAIQATPAKEPYKLMTQEQDPRVQMMQLWRQNKAARRQLEQGRARLSPDETAKIKAALTLVKSPSTEPPPAPGVTTPQSPQRGVSGRVISERQAQMNPEAIQQELVRRGLAIREAEAAGRPDMAQMIRGGSIRAMPGSRYLGAAPQVLMGIQSGLMDLLQHQPINVMHLLGLPTLEEATQTVARQPPTGA